MSDSSLKHPVQVLTAKELHRLFKFRVQGLSLSKRAEFNGEPPTGIEMTGRDAEEFMGDHGIAPHIPLPSVETSAAMHGKG